MVRDENSPRIPIRSKPALQKAETEWNTAYQSPLAQPKSFMKVGARSTAPIPSTRKEEVRMNFISLTTPPILWADMASCMVFLAKRPILLPERIARNPAMDTTPKPPIWIRIRITISPKSVQWVAVSWTTRPVTQVAEVLVKRASRKDVCSPALVENGRERRMVPKIITAMNPKTMVWNGVKWNLGLLCNMSFSIINRN